MSILISADFRFVTKNVGINTMYSRGNTEIKLWLFVVVSDELNSLVKCRRRNLKQLSTTPWINEEILAKIDYAPRQTQDPKVLIF